MRSLLIGLLIFISGVSIAQSSKSPEQFLGYQLGKKFTPHYRIVQYFHELAMAVPGKMKLQEYGLTNEGKELLLAIVSSPENMLRIEEIRQNNLRLTGLLDDKAGAVKAPAIVWLSYNVHGNEASSSEVSMKVLYELISGNNPAADAWLKNTVVIIDPCLNPDGRDRYVNWYNQVAGKEPVANPIAREHDEPWPGGRSNHYNFDLNRDWAWQTQVETQQRIIQYNQWMPVIHCDFHEQYPGNPYYFAPAAEPFHEVITPWQRSFQTTIGRNHARYFDANGWLYFTKEYFDLFYPAYGDTYPIYNGSIGMTYEQAGHSMAGLAIEVNEDTLKLSDRIAHHFTTSMSTIETASANAQKINEEFKKYFDEARTQGSGIYKSYLLSGASRQKLHALKELFSRNKISYAAARQGQPVKGYNYFTGKDETYITGANDLVVSTLQPKGALVKVLFEPQSKLPDSSTYDITAWALPYAYGIPAYAVKEKVAVQENPSSLQVPAVLSNTDYAYLVEYASFSGGKLLAAMLQNGIKLRFAEKDFTYKGKKYSKGTLVVLRSINEGRIARLQELVNRFDAAVTGVSTGFMDSGFDFGSEKLHILKKPSVAMLTGEAASSTAAGEIWHFFEQQLNYPVTLINAGSIGNVNLKNIDVLIIPDGNYKILTEKESSLKSWVRQGGKIIALENAVAQMSAGEWGIKLKKEEDEKPEDKKPSYADIKRYEDRERQGIIYNTPGAIYKVDLDESHPLAFGYPDYYYTLKLNSNLYEFMKEGWNVGVIKKETRVAGFVGSSAKEKLKDGTVIAVQQFGNGTIICFADNPLFRSFWENGKLLFTNAVFLAGQ